MESKHLIWATTLMLIVLMICSTIIYINYNSWTLRFEMDDNTKEAIESIDIPNIEPEIVCYEKEHRIYGVWDYRNNIISNVTHDLGYTWLKTTCPYEFVKEG